MSRLFSPGRPSREIQNGLEFDLDDFCERHGESIAQYVERCRTCESANVQRRVSSHTEDHGEHFEEEYTKCLDCGACDDPAAYYDTPGADHFDAMLTAAIQRHEKHAAFLAKQPAEEIGQ